MAEPSPALQLTVAPTAPFVTPAHPSLPQRPAYDFAAQADSIGFGASPTSQSILNASTAAQALAGSNHDVVANRRAIRMANMSAAEMLKAELSGNSLKPPLKQPELDLSLPPKPPAVASLPPSATTIEAVPMNNNSSLDDTDMEIPGLGAHHVAMSPPASNVPSFEGDADAEGEPDPEVSGVAVVPAAEGQPLASDIEMTKSPEPDGGYVTGVKRKLEDTEEDLDLGSEDEDTSPAVSAFAMKVNPDGTVEQEDKVKCVVYLTVTNFL